MTSLFLHKALNNVIIKNLLWQSFYQAFILYLVVS